MYIRLDHHGDLYIHRRVPEEESERERVSPRESEGIGEEREHSKKFTEPRSRLLLTGGIQKWMGADRG